MNKTRYLAQALAMAAAMGLSVGAAKAAMVDYNIGDGGLESFNITYNDSGSHFTSISGALAGGIAITKVTGSAQQGTQPAGFPASYTTVCTDIGGTVYLGSTYGYDQQGFTGQTGVRPSWGLNAYDGTLQAPALLGEQQEAIQNAADIFYTHFSALSGSSTTDKAALQLAVWAAVYNTGLNGAVADVTYSGGVGSISGGRFTVSGGDQAAINEAALWLQGLTGSYGLTGNLLYPDPTYQGNGDGLPVQELLIRTQDSTPVPEPTTMIAGALLLLPFGASILRFVRKNRAA
jgi:hypothetical protein